MTERTIAVTGKGILRLVPDLARLTLAVSASDADYAAAVRAAEEHAANVKNALAGVAGAENVKAASVRVEPHFETVTENGVQTRRQTGYTATRRLRAELCARPALLAEALQAVAQSGAAPELSVEYTLAEADKARRKALALAVRDAKKRAEAIAKAADVRLSGVRSMECGAQNAFPAVRAMAMRADLADLAPEEIEICEEVRAVFDIG